MIHQLDSNIQYNIDFDNIASLREVAKDMKVIGKGLAHYLYAIGREDVETISLSLNGRVLKTFYILDILEKTQPLGTYRLRRRFINLVHSQEVLESLLPL
jgi:hypothetical protein